MHITHAQPESFSFLASKNITPQISRPPYLFAEPPAVTRMIREHENCSRLGEIPCGVDPSFAITKSCNGANASIFFRVFSFRCGYSMHLTAFFGLLQYYGL
jgi:hypothetical protein